MLKLHFHALWVKLEKNWSLFSKFTQTSSNHRLESAGLNALEELLFKMLEIEKMVACECRCISGCRLSSAEQVTAANTSAFAG